MSDPDFILGLAGFQVSRLLQDGPEVSALQALSFPHSHDFSEGPPPAELIREVRQLRCPLGVCFVSFLLCVLSQACCAVDGWNLYGAGPEVPTHCRPLKYWLSAYLASTLLPLTTSMALALPLGILAMATGTLVRALTPASCKNEAPSLWQFVDEVGAKGLVCLVGLLIIAGLCAATIFPAIRAIDARWGASGSAVTEVIEAIRDDQPPEDGQKLIDAVKRSDSEVVVELSWDIPSQNVVLVDQWLNTASAASHKFLKEFAPKRAALNEYLQFVPHYHVFSLEGKDYKDLCSDSTGKYCADDPDGGGEITGKQVLHEAVRQLCIHEITVVPTGERIAQKWHMRQAKFSTEWWDYVSKYLDECPATGSDDPLHTFGEKCSERLMHQVGLDVEKVEECIRNTKEDKLAYQRENSAWSSDALRINGWRYSGTMDADLVTKAICAGFVSTPEPCTRLTTPANPFNLDGVVPMPAASGVSNSQVMEVFIVLALVAVGFMYFYKRSMTRNIHTALREEVMLEVQSQMAQYKQLGDL
ncbi:BP80 [Symbiodinium sp. KB8]|nr:BP80 [Symbiodinium sp. KB8]